MPEVGPVEVTEDDVKGAWLADCEAVCLVSCAPLSGPAPQYVLVGEKCA